MNQRIDVKLVSKLEAQEKRSLIRDDEINGLVLRIYATGRIDFNMDYCSPCGENKGREVQHQVGTSHLDRFQGSTALPKQLQQSAITGIRKDARRARALVDAGQDPSQPKLESNAHFYE